MSRFACPLLVIAAAALAIPFAPPTPAAPVPKGRPAARGDGPNSNALVKHFRDRLTFSTSGDWQGWPPDKAFDFNPETSWFSTSGDSPAVGKAVWLAVHFPEDVAVGRVTVLGNREPGSPAGYSVLLGRLELLDKDGRAVVRAEREGKGEKYDLDFVLCESFGRVRTVKFTPVKDETSEGRAQTKCVGVAEIQIE